MSVAEKRNGELGDLKKMLDEARKKFEEDVEQMKNTNQQGEKAPRDMSQNYIVHYVLNESKFSA